MVANKSKRPWWQLTMTPSFSFVQGGIWVAVAISQWSALTSGDHETWAGTPQRVILAILSTLAAVMYLASAIMLRRRLRATGDSGAEGATSPG